MSQVLNADFSPVILEFCRIFENEMLAKIFTEFINEQAEQKPLSVENKDFDKVKKAVDSQRKYNNFFLSSMDMLKLLSYMNRSYINNCYEEKLKEQIEEKGFDTSKLSDKKGFINPGKNYVNSYRNEAAHPNLMALDAANSCMEETEKLVNQFLSARK